LTEKINKFQVVKNKIKTDIQQRFYGEVLLKLEHMTTLFRKVLLNLVARSVNLPHRTGIQ
jgi:hypothetical protein